MSDKNRQRNKSRHVWLTRKDRDETAVLEEALRAYEDLFSEAVIGLASLRGLKIGYRADILDYEREAATPRLSVTSEMEIAGHTVRIEHAVNCYDGPEYLLSVDLSPEKPGGAYDFTWETAVLDPGRPEQLELEQMARGILDALVA